jgi:hypothetical protein
MNWARERPGWAARPLSLDDLLVVRGPLPMVEPWKTEAPTSASRPRAGPLSTTTRQIIRSGFVRRRRTSTSRTYRTRSSSRLWFSGVGWSRRRSSARTETVSRCLSNSSSRMGSRGSLARAGETPGRCSRVVVLHLDPRATVARFVGTAQRLGVDAFEFIGGGQRGNNRLSSRTSSSSSSRATSAARERTSNFANMRRRCVDTVHELIPSFAAIVLLG